MVYHPQYARRDVREVVTMTNDWLRHQWFSLLVELGHVPTEIKIIAIQMAKDARRNNERQQVTFATDKEALEKLGRD